MDIDKVRSAYDYFSGKASEIARQLSFAGIAIVWIFSGGGASTGAAVHIPNDLFRIGAILVVALTLDFLHYVSATAIWGVYGRIKERDLRSGAANSQFLAPRWINYPPLAFFWTKLAAVGLAYVLLAFALLSRLH